jgi:ribosome biogenesis GTPase A
MVRVRYSFGSRHTGNLGNIAKQRVKFPAVMKEVIRISDVVLQVLDARFVEDMRNEELEKMLDRMGKKTIYVLNKADLVDVKEMEARLPKDMRPYVFVSVKTGQGVNELRDRIRIEAKRVEMPSGMNRVHVGVVGYPNAGKSSLINKIARRGVASISKQAGHTKGMQKIRLCEGILLLDTPGVIPESEYKESDKERRSLDAKLGSRTYSDVRDPEIVVNYLVSAPVLKDKDNPTEDEIRMTKDAKRNSEAIDRFYGIESDGDSELLIEELGKKKNYLKKGGEVDTDRTARVILKDWQEGKITSARG